MQQNNTTQRTLLLVIISTELFRNNEKILMFSVGNLNRCQSEPYKALKMLLNAHPSTRHRKQMVHSEC